MIYGDKVGLRPVEEEDLPLLAQWRNDPQSRSMFLMPLLLPVSGQKKWYEAVLNDPTQMRFMVVRLDNQAVVGTISLLHIDYRNQMAEMGSDIIIPAERGHHFGLDATRALIRYAFEELNLRRLYGTGLSANTIGMRKHMRAGFKPEGIGRKAVLVNGEFQDAIYLGLLREEWQEGR